MSYGRTPLQERLLVGRRLLNRHYYGDGRWGIRSRRGVEIREFAPWTIVKQHPKATTWARPSGPLGRKTHAIRYSLTATRTTGEVVRLIVWLCGQHAYSEPVPQSHPRLVCAACLARITKATEVALPVGASGGIS